MQQWRERAAERWERKRERWERRMQPRGSSLGMSSPAGKVPWSTTHTVPPEFDEGEKE